MMSPRAVGTIALLLVLLPAALAQADSTVLAPYKADYSLALHGISVGESRFSLAPDGEGKYLYTADAHTTGLGALLKSGFKTSQKSRFTLADGRLQALSYDYAEQDGDEKSSEDIVFDWDKRSAMCDEGGRQKANLLTPETYDVFLIQLAVAMDMEKGALAKKYTLLDHGETAEYTSSQLPDQKMYVDKTELDTVALRLHSDRKGRTISVWLAPALHYLPVKIEQDKPAMVLTLDDISFETPAPAASTAAH